MAEFPDLVIMIISYTTTTPTPHLVVLSTTKPRV
jgi:hypothetical protein